MSRDGGVNVTNSWNLKKMDHEKVALRRKKNLSLLGIEP